jgi:protein AroM
MLGLVTIGQSPRDDVVTSLLERLEPGAVQEAGALDLLDRHEIDSLAPSSGEQPLVTRLRDGSEVVVGKAAVLPHLRDAVARLEASGCGTICVLCTGEFPPLGRDALVIYPDRLMLHLVEALLPVGTLGVLMPHAGQHEGMVAKWTTQTRSTVTAVASPYSAGDQIATEVRRLVEADAQVIVLDCMGFDRRMLDDARAETSKPVLLANGLVGAVLREMVGVSVGLVDQVQRP